MQGKFFLVLIGVFFSIAPKANNLNEVTYLLQKEFYPQLQIRVEVNTEKLGTFTVSRSRFYQGDERPDKQLFCADNDTPIAYGRPQTCRLVYWIIGVKKQSMIGLGARSREDYYLNNGQWILSESRNFPRFSHVTKAVVCIGQQRCEPLPTIKEPFLFLVWGKTPTSVNLVGKQFEIYSDKIAESIDKRRLMIQLEPNLRYLNKVFTNQLGDHIERPISVIMLGQDDRVLKDAGGAAKDHMALVNYYTQGAGFAENWEPRFQETMLHEYVHLLVPCSSFPRWACESLADYYSYKSLSLGHLNNTALELWQRSNKNALNKLGLYEIDKKFWETKSFNYYALFYIKGAAFWNELDIALNKKYRNLDNYLHLLVLEPATYQSTLPQVFTSQMIEIIGNEKFKQLSAKYLE